MLMPILLSSDHRYAGNCHPCGLLWTATIQVSRFSRCWPFLRLHCFALWQYFCLRLLQSRWSTGFRGSSLLVWFPPVSWFILTPPGDWVGPPRELLSHFWWRAFLLRGPARGVCGGHQAFVGVHFWICYQEELVMPEWRSYVCFACV